MFYILSLILAKYWTENHEAVLYQPYFFHSRYYRIPAITTAKDGSLICATDMRWKAKNDLPALISTTIRISPDDGLSWTDNQIISGPPRKVGDGDPSLVTDRKTGTIVCLWNGDKGFNSATQKDPLRIYVSRSYDNGRTWEPKRDITSSIYSNLCTNCSQDRYTWTSMFISSGNILQLRDGRILVAGITRCWGQIRAYTVYSDDVGETWTASENPACKTADESKFFETNDGIVVISVRHKPSRIFAYSRDRGVTWENETVMTDIWDSPCNGEVIRYTSTIDGYDKDRLLHTVTYVQNFPRRNVSVLLSYDEGKTWPVKKTLRGDPQLLGSYSTISIGHSGLIHIYYEKGTSDTDPDSFNMTVHTISLEWLTDGADTYKKAENLRWCVCDDREDELCNAECPDGYYKSTAQIFDQYVESYFEYPTKMSYVFPNGARDFGVNLSVHGLKSATYVNKKIEKRPFISFVGMNDLDDQEEAEEKSFEMENVDAKASFDQVYFNSFALKGASRITVPDGVSKIEVGKTQIRLTKGSSLTGKSNTIRLDGSESRVEVLNGITDENVPLDVYNGIEGMPGEETAAVGLVITAAKLKTKIRINGLWANADGQKLITIASDGSNTGTSVSTRSENKDMFDIIGSQPDFEYLDPPQTTTKVPTDIVTEKPTDIVTEKPTEIITKEPTKVPTEAPSLEPSVSQPSQNDENSDNDSKGSKGSNMTLIIIAVVCAVVAVAGITAAVVFFLKLKKKNGVDELKSEGTAEYKEALKSPLLF